VTRSLSDHVREEVRFDFAPALLPRVPDRVIIDEAGDQVPEPFGLEAKPLRELQDRPIRHLDGDVAERERHAA